MFITLVALVIVVVYIFKKGILKLEIDVRKLSKEERKREGLLIINGKKIL